MKRNLLSSVFSISILGGMLALTSPAFGQAKPPAAKPAAGAPAAAGAPTRVHNYDFEADNIDGELVKPEGEFMSARKAAEHGSLIRIRTDFIREIVKSAEDL